MNEQGIYLRIDCALKSATQVTRLVDTEPECLDSKVARRFLAGLELCLVEMRVVEQRNHPGLGNHFPDDLNPLAGDFGRVEENAGYIAAWPVETLRGAVRDRIGLQIQRNDWDSFRSLTRSHKTARRDSKNDFHVRHQFGSILAQQLAIALGGTHDQYNFLIAQLTTKSFSKQSFALRAEQTRE
jgi:hypothetical protein